MDLTALTIDKALPTPAYLQLKDKLLQAFEAGQLRPGTALPSERDLAGAVSLSRMTVRRAFEELVAANLVEQRQGSGTYVLPKRLEQTVDRVLGFTDEARTLGFEAGSRILSAEHVAADPAAAAALQVAANLFVLRVRRLRTADGAPLALQTAQLAPRFSRLSLHRLESSGSLYKTIQEQYGVTPHAARQTVRARLPTRTEQDVLNLHGGSPVMAMERVTFGVDGVPFEFVRSVYRGDRYQMALELRAP